MKRFFLALGITLALNLVAFAQVPATTSTNSILSVNSNASAEAVGLKVTDLFKFKRVGDPQVSPDGKTVAYVVTSYDRETNKRTSQIYLSAINGTDAQLLPESSGKESRPRWSPNGKLLAGMC